jgi:adenylyl-sulfate kinase
MKPLRCHRVWQPMQTHSPQGERKDGAAGYRPHVFWLFGLSGAGKSTLSLLVQAELEAILGIRGLMLDGDRLRNGICRGLGFSEADRAENLRRAAEAARLGLESHLVVIAAFITPREENRRMIEQIVGLENLSLIHIDAALEVCRERDVKGLYAKAAAGQVPQMTGVSSGFDAPSRCALRLDTAAEHPAASAERLVRFARERIGRPEAGDGGAAQAVAV